MINDSHISGSKLTPGRYPPAVIVNSALAMLRIAPQTNLPPLEELLASGGDSRTVLDSHGVNKYGCFSVPQPDILSYGSCTASTISETGFAAATQLYRRLQYASRREPACVTYAREMKRIRATLAELCGVATLPGLEIILGASGTDLHLFAAQLLSKADAPLLVVMAESAETGSGVPAALHGDHFSDRTALGRTVVAGEAIKRANPIEVAAVKCRQHCGDLRSPSIVDAEVEARVMHAVKEGHHVLLTLADLSKTGLIVPSVACALGLKRRFPDKVDIVVDACQFRLSHATLRAYLVQDCLVAMTGSKFVAGPTFCGALLVPKHIARKLRGSVPPALGSYSPRADWPETWAPRLGLANTANYGLLLRFEAALAQLRAFCALPEADVTAFCETFARAVQKRLEDDPVFEPLPAAEINRTPLMGIKTWDQLPTIFPFRMRHLKSGALLNKDEIATIYERMKTARCQVGQPVACGALRLCVDMRLINEALSSKGCGTNAVIANAMRVLDTAAMMVEQLAIAA